MTYVNPIEILDIGRLNPIDIDSSVIKKKKRILIADIDLSDDSSFNYHSYKITRSDCEKAIEELENKNKLEFYFHLANNKELNSFLANGDTKHLDKLKHESIYALPEFIEFISPFVSFRINQSLLKSFENADYELFCLSLSLEYLISKDYHIKAYSGLGNEIKQRIDEIDILKEEIDEENPIHSEKSIKDIVKLVENQFPIDFLNKLPLYFQSQINKIASSINFLQLTIWNKFDITNTPLLLLEHLLKLNIESVSKPTFEKNYSIIKKKHEQRLIQEKNAPFLKKWAEILLSFKSKIEDIESNKVTVVYVLDLVNSKLDIAELNNLPDFADDIRTQIALSIRSMAISGWNDQSDMKNSLALINVALKIKTDSETEKKFKSDKSDLEDIKEKNKGHFECYFCDGLNTPDKGFEVIKTIYKETDRSVWRRSVNYSYVDVSVPRCKNCHSIHDKANTYYLASLIIISVVGAFIGFANSDFIGFILGGSAGAGIGFLTGNALKSYVNKDNNIKGDSNYNLSRHPILKLRMITGWSFSKPSA